MIWIWRPLLDTLNETANLNGFVPSSISAQPLFIGVPHVLCCIRAKISNENVPTDDTWVIDPKTKNAYLIYRCLILRACFDELEQVTS